MSHDISPYCIYTIRHTEILNDCFKSGGTGEFTEGTKWVTGRRLFLDAQRDETRMPVIFAAADVGGGLLYYAWLKDVKVSDEDSTTTYKFTGLKRITNKPPKNSLKLMNTNRPLSNDFIRPYALCHTPPFIKGQKKE
jgi:hypothetical protein